MAMSSNLNSCLTLSMWMVSLLCKFVIFCLACLASKSSNAAARACLSLL